MGWESPTLEACPSEVKRLYEIADGILDFKKDGIVTLEEINRAITKEQKLLQDLQNKLLQKGGQTLSEFTDQKYGQGKTLNLAQATEDMKRVVAFLQETRRKILQSGALRYFKGCSLNPKTNEATPGVCEGLSEIPHRFVDCYEFPAFRVHRLAGWSEEYANFARYLKDSKGDYRGSVRTLDQGGRYVEIDFPQKGTHQPTLALTAQDLRVILDYRTLAHEYQMDRNRYAKLFRSRQVVRLPNGSFQIAGRKATALEVWGLLQTEHFMKEFENTSLPEATEEKRNKFRRALEEKGMIPLKQDWSRNLEGTILFDLYDQKDGQLKAYALVIPDLVTSRHFASQRRVTFDIYLQWVGNTSGLQKYEPYERWESKTMSLGEGLRLREEMIENPR